MANVTFDDVSHEICDSCFTQKFHSLNRKCCPLVPCPNNASCTAELHRCKLDDHVSYVCLFQRIPCVNLCNGCTFELRRCDMYLHLKTCPASVVRCMAEWNRWPIFPPGVGGIHISDDDGGDDSHAHDDENIIRTSDPDCLDLSLMRRDQRLLEESRKIPLKLKSALRNNINRKHPAAPVEIPLTWINDELVPSAKSSSTTVSSDDDPNAPWNLTRSPPGLVGSVTESELFSKMNNDRNNENDSVERNSPVVSLGYLLHFLMQLSDEFPDESLLSVETENVAEILLNVEKNAARVENLAISVLEDLVVYPKKIAEDLRDVTSDLEDWAEDLRDRVAVNLAVVARKLTTNWRGRGGSCGRECRLILNDATLDAIGRGDAHETVHRTLTAVHAKTRALAAELEKADRITAGTRPRQIARNLRVNVINPLRVAATGESNDVDVDDDRAVRGNEWDDDYESAAENEEVVDSLANGEISLPAVVQSSSAAPSCNLEFGLAGLKQLAKSYAQPEMVVAAEAPPTLADSPPIKLPSPGPKSDVRFSDENTSPTCNAPRGRIAMRLNKEMLPRSQPKPKSMFTFLCAQDFRRDEFENHARFTHDVVDAGLACWVERRCPLARLGCPFAIRPLVPCGLSGRLIFDDHLNAFGVQPLAESHRLQQQPPQQRAVDCLDTLPPEILEGIFRKLDGFSLNHVSRTCKYFRDVCFGLLEEKGLVTPVWKRISKSFDGMAAAWRVSHYRWFFSNDAVAEKWILTNASVKISEHLQTCSFNVKKILPEDKVLVMTIDDSCQNLRRNSSRIAKWCKMLQDDRFFI